MTRHHSLFVVLASFVITASTLGCAVDATDDSSASRASSALTVTVTAADVARLSPGDVLVVDPERATYRFDPRGDAIDFSRVVVGEAREDGVPITGVIAEAAALAGRTVEDVMAAPFLLEHATPPAPAGGLTPKVWCAVRVWILPAHEDDIFRIGYVAVWKKHC